MSSIAGNFEIKWWYSFYNMNHFEILKFNWKQFTKQENKSNHIITEDIRKAYAKIKDNTYMDGIVWLTVRLRYSKIFTFTMIPLLP